MDGLEGVRSAYLKRLKGLYSRETQDIKPYVEALEAAIKILEADPRLKLTADDLAGSIEDANDQATLEHVLSWDGNVTEETMERQRRLYFARLAAEATKERNP